MEIPRISPQEVGARIRKGDRIAFVDARSAKAYEQAVEQIPGSIRVPPDDIDGHVPELPHAVTVVAYCT